MTGVQTCALPIYRHRWSYKEIRDNNWLMSFAPNIIRKRCFVACHPDIVKRGGCSCNNLSAISYSRVSQIRNRIYKIKYILNNGEKRDKVWNEIYQKNCKDN